MADTAALGRWIRSWIQPNGSIHGFHNHSVWGGNPYRVGDYTAGHSTWASPVIAGLASVLKKRPDDRGLELVRRLIACQSADFLENGNYEHIGFQIGELLKVGLIHNAIANASLADALAEGGDRLGDEPREQVRQAFERNRPWHARVGDFFTTNQEYARIWGQLLYYRAFEDARFLDAAFEDLDILSERAFIRGLPDADCAGTVRHPNDPLIAEPAEYYGLMILPMILAYEISGDQKYLDDAGAICRHVVRSMWTDEQGRARVHRFWMRLDGNWECVREPMLISGMGDTLQGMWAYLRHRDDEEMRAALDALEATYTHYQHPAGFFVAASGWNTEADVVPSTAWHAHDFRYLAKSSEPEPDFWDRFFNDYDRMALVLGSTCLYVEEAEHWAISDYAYSNVYKLLGRKDRVHFGYDMGWIGGPTALAEEYNFTRPKIAKVNDRIVFLESAVPGTDILNHSGLPLAE